MLQQQFTLNPCSFWKSQTFVESRENQSQWRFTVAGMRCVIPAQLFTIRWGGEHSFLRTRQDTPLLKQHTFELLTALLSQGFQFCVKRRVRRHRAAEAAQLPVAYDVSAAEPVKQFWALPSETRLHHAYLLALATANEHKKVVEHFRSSLYYYQLVNGDEGPLPRQVRPRRRGEELAFAMEDDLHEEARPLQPRKRRRQARALNFLAAEMPSGEHEPGNAQGVSYNFKRRPPWSQAPRPPPFSIKLSKPHGCCCSDLSTD